MTTAVGLYVTRHITTSGETQQSSHALPQAIQRRFLLTVRHTTLRADTGC